MFLETIFGRRRLKTRILSDRLFRDLVDVALDRERVRPWSAFLSAGGARAHGVACKTQERVKGVGFGCAVGGGCLFACCMGHFRVEVVFGVLMMRTMNIFSHVVFCVLVLFLRCHWCFVDRVGARASFGGKVSGFTIHVQV